MGELLLVLAIGLVLGAMCAFAFVRVSGMRTTMGEMHKLIAAASTSAEDTKRHVISARTQLSDLDHEIAQLFEKLSIRRQ